MKLINTEHQNKTAILKLNRDIKNAINPQLVNELSDELQKIRNDANVNSVVLGSLGEKFFSIGLDIPRLYELSREDFKKFLQAYDRLCIELYTLPKPTIIAITGHAIAGGCILALCCDYRFIAEGRKLMGLNEVKLGVPVPYPADCILQNLIGSRNAREIMNTGEFYQSEDLLKMGVVDQVLPLEQVLPKSVEKAESLGALPQKAFGAIKRNRTEIVEKQILKHLAEKEDFFIDCWYSDEVRERLKEAVKKF
ncbi:MAG: enoyl-CoA hydratase/isomerase family protein [Thermoplasmata archaeon]